MGNMLGLFRFKDFVVLRHLVAELLTTEDVEVQVLYGLAAVVADVADDSVAVFKAEHSGNFRYSGENVGDDVGVFFCDLICR